jgi:hypothetical protein
MSFEPIALFGAVLVSITSALILIVDDWRANLGLLALQYVGAFSLVGIEWPLALSISHLVAGWIAAAVLGMAMLSLPSQVSQLQDIERTAAETSRLARRLRLGSDRAPNLIFIILTILLIALTVFSQIPRLMDWIPGLRLAQAWGGLILCGMALLHLGFYSQPLRVVIGLLTLFTGFLVLYAVVNPTTLAAALSATITLGLALAGAYLTLSPHMEPGE